MSESDIWYKEGCQFLKGGTGSKKKFNATIRYNLMAMAFEKFVMAILYRYKKLPDNHTFTDFVEALERIIPLDTEMKRTIYRLESAQQICSFTDCFQRELDDRDLDIMKDLVETFRGMAEYHLNTPDAVPV